MAEAMTREEAIEGLRSVLSKGSPSEVAPYAKVLIGDRWPKVSDLPANPTPKHFMVLYWRVKLAMGELQTILDGEGLTMAENRSREEAIEELRGIIGKGTYAEVTPLAREIIGDEWPTPQEESSYTNEGQDLFFSRFISGYDKLLKILNE